MGVILRRIQLFSIVNTVMTVRLPCRNYIPGIALTVFFHRSFTQRSQHRRYDGPLGVSDGAVGVPLLGPAFPRRRGFSFLPVRAGGVELDSLHRRGVAMDNLVKCPYCEGTTYRLLKEPRTVECQDCGRSFSFDAVVQQQQAPSEKPRQPG